MTTANKNLVARVSRYTIEKHEGLVRFYHDKRKIPFHKVAKYAITGENIKKGNIIIKKDAIVRKEYIKDGMLTFDQEWYEQDHWAWDDKTGNVYRIKVQNNSETERKLCGNIPVTQSRESVLARILDRDITTSDAYDPTNRSHARWVDGADTKQLVKWSVEMDGKNILAIVIAKPKMTYNEIRNVIINEGGSIDSNGIIHRPQ